MRPEQCGLARDVRVPLGMEGGRRDCGRALIEVEAVDLHRAGVGFGFVALEARNAGSVSLTVTGGGLTVTNTAAAKVSTTVSYEDAGKTLVIDVAAGDKIPRKGGPGITRSDLLVINKIDLPHADIPMAAMWTYRPDLGPNPTAIADMRGAASVAHLAYKSFLTFAYERGDLSRV